MKPRTLVISLDETKERQKERNISLCIVNVRK